MSKPIAPPAARAHSAAPGLDAQPDAADALAALPRAMALCQRGENAEAERLCRRALNADPTSFEALTTLGIIAARTQRAAGAAALFNLAVAQRPQDAAAHKNLGNALKQTLQFDAALEAYREAVRLEPDHVVAHTNLGTLLLNLSRFESALASYERALALAGTAEAHFNCGAALTKLERFEEAFTAFGRALDLKHDLPSAHLNRGMVYHLRGDPAAAIACYDAAIALAPGFSAAHLNRAYAYLLTGDYERGWPEHEWRLRHPIFNVTYPPALSRPRWDGGSLEGRTILVTCEQGLGDTLQFCRYVPELAARGARVLLQAQKPLSALLERLPGVWRVVVPGEKLPLFDCHYPLLSLPLAFKTTEATIPRATQYLAADPRKVVEWSERLGPRTRPRVGLVWSGDARSSQVAVTRRRNIPLRTLAAIRRPGLDFISVQKGEAAEAELAALGAADDPGAPPIRGFAERLVDFSATAALLANLDLLISVDTSTAHLAGALGRPVWLLNRFDGCWRWLRDREDSPWYPTARIYRQTRLGDWGAVLLRVAADLRRFEA